MAMLRAHPGSGGVKGTHHLSAPGTARNCSTSRHVRPPSRLWNTDAGWVVANSVSRSWGARATFQTT
jgi:hypothetical protein